MPYNNILLCYDSTREGRRALLQGAELAQKLSAETHLLAIAATIVGREMVIMGLRASAALQGVLIVASQLGRVKAAIQFVAILVSLLNLDQRVGPVGLDQWVMLAAVLITFGSGVDYLVRFSRASLTKSGQSAGR